MCVGDRQRRGRVLIDTVLHIAWIAGRHAARPEKESRIPRKAGSEKTQHLPRLGFAEILKKIRMDTCQTLRNR